MKRVIFTAATVGLLALGFQGCKSDKATSETKATDSKPMDLKDKKDKLSYTLGVTIGKTLHQQKIELSQDQFATGFKDGLSEKTDKTRVSYGIGAEVGSNFHKQKIDVNDNSFMAGLKDALIEGKTTQMTEADMRQAMMDFQKEKMEAAKKEHDAESTKNLEANNKFFEENAKKKDVVTLPSGLQYRIIKDGAGESPKASDKVKAHYVGKLIDGKEFDSSAKHGSAPAEFNVTGVIAGWTEALQLMKPGAKWEIFVPAKLGYGEQGSGQVIPPNSALVFEIELVSFEKGAAPASVKPMAKPGNTVMTKKSAAK